MSRVIAPVPKLLRSILGISSLISGDPAVERPPSISSPHSLEESLFFPSVAAIRKPPGRAPAPPLFSLPVGVLIL